MGVGMGGGVLVVSTKVKGRRGPLWRRRGREGRREGGGGPCALTGNRVFTLYVNELDFPFLFFGG